jgi:hypothetical protein
VLDGRVRNALEAVAATHLPSRHVDASALSGQAECDLLHAISRERLTGLAVSAVANGQFALSDDAFEDLLHRHDDQLALDLRLERLLLEATERLRREGVSYRAVKGPVLAHTVYGDPTLRSFGDIDLLVHSTQFDDAVPTLQALGFMRRFVEPRAGFDARFTKGACVVRADGLEVDLHRTLAPGPFGVRVGRHNFFATPARTIELGGMTFDAVDRETAFVHACFHAALGDSPPRLVPIRDVIECYLAGIDEDAVMEAATSVRCEAVFQRAITLADSVLRVHLAGPLATWARAYEATAFDRWALRSYTGVNRSYSRQLVASFCALTGLRDRVSYAAALAFPSKAYVDAREGSYTSRFVHGMREVRKSALR